VDCDHSPPLARWLCSFSLFLLPAPRTKEQPTPEMTATNKDTSMELDFSAAIQSINDTKKEPQAPLHLFSCLDNSADSALFLNFKFTIEKSFVIDFVCCLSYTIIYGVAGQVKPFPVYARRFFLNDESLSYPIFSNIVPMWVVYFSSMLVPLLVLLFSWAAFRFPRKSALLLLSVLMRAHAFNHFSTLFIKCLVGRPRPNFMRSCRPTTVDCVGEMCSSQTCAAAHHEVVDAFMSLPSGHTSVMFVGMTWLSVFVWLVTRPHVTGNLIGVLISFCPFVAGAFVAISRTQDFNHHWEDVAVGSALGVLFTAFFFVVAYLRPPSRY